MRYLIVFTFLIGVLLAQAQEVTGEWVFRMSGPNGETVEAQLLLKNEDGKLTGSFLFPQGRKLELEEGRVDGNKLKFLIRRERPQGGVAVYKMEGQWEGSNMKGTAETDMFGENVKAEWTATRK
ncbi:MAG: hypothetical protein NZV14_05065 [Bryobacteraceae bacterium]|nr:hypothetical protein [Bryobacteraceae bacterium]MDW8377506.1 hypothetical protein [Bryobacterales bacterium]